MRLRIVRFKKEMELSDEWVIENTWYEGKEAIVLLSDTRRMHERGSVIGFDVSQTEDTE